MYNPNVKLPPAPKSQPLPFILEDTVNKTRVELLITPTIQEYEYSAEYSKLAVLGREQPIIVYKASEHTVNISDVKFWTYGNSSDLTQYLGQIAAFTKPDRQSLEPPTLKLTLGTVVYDRIKLSKFKYKVTELRGGTPTSAEGSLEFMLDPLPPEPTLAPATTVLSEPERTKAVTSITELLDTDAKKATLYQYTKGKSKVLVEPDGSVNIENGTDKLPIGKVSDILGSATPPAITPTTAEAKKATTVKPAAPV